MQLMQIINPFHKKKPLDDQAIQYATFNLRMFASPIDIIIIMVVAVPMIDFINKRLFVPIDANVIAQNFPPEILQDSVKLKAVIIKIINDYDLVARILFINFMQLFFVGIYVIPCWFRYKTTIGKMILRIEIRDETSMELMTKQQIVKRFISYIISFIPFSMGFVWILFNKKRKAWHDIIAGTIVVKKPKKT